MVVGILLLVGFMVGLVDDVILVWIDVEVVCLFIW